MTMLTTPRPSESRASSDGAVGRLGQAPVAESPAMREVLTAAEDVAVAGTTVLVLGESGTGKEIVARHIHRCSPRADGPWVAVNCAALPTELLEGELFGHERGAFTGATERRIGRIEQAHRGTLLLDEVSELPWPLQAKLLRVLQEREVDRIGGTRPIPVDVRVIATSNRPLAQMVAEREFRADLYYRLNVFPIVLPPLRERLQDIHALADDFVRVLSHALGRSAPVLGVEAMRALESYAFPGNVRELGNILERALVRCREPVLDLRHLDLPMAPGRVRVPAGETTDALPASEVAQPGDPAFPADLPIDLATLERLAIGQALRIEMGNRTHAARRLGISLRTLRNKLRLYRMAPETATTKASTSTAPVPAPETAAFADGQDLPGTTDPGDARARFTTLARPSQSRSSGRAA
jgi:two-component system response regulator FlrC